MLTFAQGDLNAGGNCSTFKQFGTSEILTAPDLNNSFTTVGVTNMTPDCLGGASANITAMKQTVDPFPAGAESLATSLTGELQRLRFMLGKVAGFATWYQYSTQAALPTFNFVTNGDFESWPAGASSAPGSWTLTGAGAAVAKNTTAGQFKISTASAQVTPGGGATGQLYQDIDLTTGYGPVAWWQGKTVTLGAWVRATAASQANLALDDGVTTTASGFHTGTSLFQFLQVTATLSASATRVRVLMQVAAAGAAAQFDGVTIVQGGIVTDFQPNPVASQIAAPVIAVGSYGVRNLVGQNDATTPNTKFGYSADLVVLRNPTDGSIVVRTNTGTLTNDTGLAGSAANGRDQAAAFGASTWVHFYFIWNGTTLSTLSSTVAPPTGPTLPTGYTHWAYAGAVRYNATPLLVKTRMRGAMMSYELRQNALLDGGATVETAVDLTTFVPPNANAIQVRLSGQYATTNDIHFRYVTGVDFYNTLTNSASTVELNTTAWFPNLSQQIFYLRDLASATVDIDVLSYRIPNGGE